MKKFVFALAVVGLTLGWSAATTRAAEAKRPNLVFIFSDDHAYQAISAYGDPRKLLDTPQHRPHRAGGRAVRSLPDHQFDLRTQPRRGADRQVQPPERLLQQHEQPLRRLANDDAQTAASRRLPDGDFRQVAPGQRSHGFRLLAHPARPGRVLQPAHDPQRRARAASRLHHRHHHRPVARMAHATATGRSRSC